ncbi:MAG TPA: GGDEF domain-containing protein [Xanthomonadaceae bacterium]|nr:GGDEF domain-containing protein [Xanthomonadaceae bacterium]
MGKCFRFLAIAVLAAATMRAAPGAESGAIVTVHGANPGAPLMRRFASADQGGHPGNLHVLADPSGVVYAGNYEGVLRYAAGHFELIALPGAAPARALALGRDGRIYVASYDHFGVIEADAQGELKYHDLRRAFALEGRDALLGSVWSVHALDEAVYFHAADHLYRYAYDGQTQRFDLPPQTRAFHDTGTELYTRVEGEGMKQFRTGHLVAVPGGDLFANRPLDLVVPNGDGELLLFTREGGLFIADETGIRPQPNRFAWLFAKHVPYAFARLSDGSLAVGTLSGELMVFAPDMTPQQRYRIGVYSVMGLSVDAEHGLWAATQGGLLRIQLPSPWTAIAADEGLPGQVSATAWHDGVLWIAGARGLSRSSASDMGEIRIVPHGAFTDDVWDLASTPAGLLATRSDGIHRITSDGVELALALEEPYLLAQPDDNPARVFAAGESMVWVIEAGSSTTALLHEIALEGASIASIQPMSDTELWIGDYRGTPWRLRLSNDGREQLELRRFDEADGVDIDPEHGSITFRLDGDLHILTGTRVLAWNGRRFEASEADGLAALLDREGELSLIDTPGGTFALTSRALFHRPRPGAGWRSMQIDSPLARGFSTLDFNSDGVLRVITWNGILQYRHGATQPPPPALRTALRGVDTNPDAQDTKAWPLAPEQAPRLPPQSSLRFRFELLSSEPQPCYRTRLLGTEQAWSACATANERAFVALPHGAYRFEVQARTPTGRVSDIASWDFEVLPYWHQTWWTRLAAALGLLLLVLLTATALSRHRHRRLEAANRELEQRIAERTVALERANRQLNQLATEDSLTGVANRRALDQGLAREWLRCADRGLSLAVLMIDVDHFKVYNDSHGHQAGDRLLRRIAEHLRSRVDDRRELLARYGGEEFVLVIPDCNLDDAMARAESLRRSIEGPDIPVTLSIGVAATIPQAGDVSSQLVRRADSALYQAKRDGRNRVAGAAHSDR